MVEGAQDESFGLQADISSWFFSLGRLFVNLNILLSLKVIFKCWGLWAPTGTILSLVTIYSIQLLFGSLKLAIYASGAKMTHQVVHLKKTFEDPSGRNSFWTWYVQKETLNVTFTENYCEVWILLSVSVTNLQGNFFFQQFQWFCCFWDSKEQVNGCFGKLNGGWGGKKGVGAAQSIYMLKREAFVTNILTFLSNFFPKKDTSR